MSKAPFWNVLESRECFSAPPYVKITKERVETDRGDIIDDYYRVDMAPFAVCVPELPDGGILTLWQYKHGPRAHGLTFPAGLLDAGEEAQAGCARELREETGCEASDWVHLGQYVDNGNQRGCVGNYFLARRCEIVTEPQSGDWESMELRIMSAKEIDAALARGDINVIHHVAAWGLARPHLTGQ